MLWSPALDTCFLKKFSVQKHEFWRTVLDTVLTQSWHQVGTHAFSAAARLTRNLYEGNASFAVCRTRTSSRREVFGEFQAVQQLYSIGGSNTSPRRTTRKSPCSNRSSGYGR